MSTAPAAATLSRNAIDVCKDVRLGDDARALLAKKPTVGQYIAILSEKGLLTDTCRVLAFALPKREAIWWACQCVRQANAAGGAKGTAALNAAERWVAAPDEKTRRAAYAAAEDAGYGTPAGCAAIAVFLSSGSLAPPEVAEVPPDETLTPKAVDGAIVLAAVTGDPVKADERFKKFIALGQDVASGKSKWSRLRVLACDRYAGVRFSRMRTALGGKRWACPPLD